MLSHLRVAVISSTFATAFAGRLLAGLGARTDTVRVGSQLVRLGQQRPDLAPLLDYLWQGTVAVDEAAAPESIRTADLVLTDVRSGAAGPPIPADQLVASLRMTRLDESVGPLDDGTLVSALAGVTWAIGEPDRYPLPMPAFTADMLVGLVFAGASVGKVLAARTGTHEVLGTAALCAFADQNSTSYRLSGIGWRREGRRAPGSAGVYPYGVYPCRDGQIVLIGRSRKDWHDIAAALGAGDLAQRYPDPFDIAAHHADAVDTLLTPYLAQRSRDQVMAVAESTGALVAPVANMSDVLSYDHLTAERDFWQQIHGMLVPGLPMQVSR